MNKVQISIFVAILLIVGVIFYITQAGYLGLNTPAKGTVNISQIPGQMNFDQGKLNPSGQPQQQQPQQSSTFDKAALEQYKTASATAVIKTSKGDITLVLYGEDAPYTVANFIMKAKTNYYNGLIFHRVEDWVVQGGDPKGDGTGGGSMPVEFNDHSFTTGALGVASTGDGVTQNDSQFFIVKSDATYLDHKYTNFGYVTNGMDVVNKIAIGDKILGITIESQ
jgi:cyclophilin family peptidyl-prolyl cis-trans isomerase